MNKAISFILIALLFNLTIIGSCFSSTLSAFSDAPVTVVTEYLAPYQIPNTDGSVGGFSTEVVNALFKQAKRKANIQIMPWARAYRTATNERNIMIYSIAKTPERVEQFQWVGNIIKERLYFWGLNYQLPLPTSVSALLKGYRIAASKNSNIDQYLTQNNFFNLYYITKEEQAMRMLYRHRIDIMIDTELNMRSRAQHLGLDITKVRKIKEVVELNNYLSIAFSKNSDPELVKHFQAAFQIISKQGLIEQLKVKWDIASKTNESSAQAN